MKRSILILGTCIAFVIVSLAFISADEPGYKNLKVLKKDISKHDLDSTMRFFTMSLGVRCTFCHVKNSDGKVSDFASDANPNKGTARFMLKMTAKINKKYFKNMDRDKEENKGNLIQSVTCYTCHHGEGHPAVKAPMGKNNMGMPPPGMGMPPQGMPHEIMRDSMRNMPADSMKGQH